MCGAVGRERALTVREVLRVAGVSHRAPRSYVPTCVFLLSAVARTGIADLVGRVAAVTARGRGRA